MRGLVVTVTLAVFVFLVLVARTAGAFCGFYVGGADARLFAGASQVVLMREGTRTVLSMQNDYQGPPESFAMVVPVPVVLQKENVKTLPRELFARLDQLDAPRLVEYWEADPCAPRGTAETKSSSARARGAVAKPAPSAAAKDLGVTIEAQFTVGEYEIVVLGARDSSGLDAWLRREGYKIPEGSEPYLRPYVASGSKFFVAKVDVAKVKMVGERATLSPLRFHYDAAELTVPVRLGLVSSPGTQDLVVHVLGKGHRYEVANYPNVTIPTNLDVAESAKDRFGSFYAALFDLVLLRTPKAVVTEYAWDAGSCDPCPLPPLTDAELVTLGADVIPSVSSESDLVESGLLRALGADGGANGPHLKAPASGPVPRRKYYGLGSSFVLTRLHARYTRDTLGEDLVLKEAPPLAGGRELRGPGGTIETSATVGAGGGNAFQGRYAIRHPWAGPIACEAPVRNVWGGPPNGLDNGPAKPALGLAYASRDNVQIASFLRSDATTLGLVAAGAPPSGVGTFAVASAPPPANGNAGAASSPGEGSGTTGQTKPSGCGACTTSSAKDGRNRGLLCTLVAAAALLGRRRRRRPPPSSRVGTALVLGGLVFAGAGAACSGGERGGSVASLSVSPVSSARLGPVASLPQPGAGPLAPSLARVVGGMDAVPRGAGAAIADVEDCTPCHADVAAQWRKSAHAFASFNNPVYRVVVDKLRAERGKGTSQFCGGCHDVALLLDGAMLADIQPTDLRAHAGITCRTCHGIAEARADGNASWDLDLSPIPIPRDGDPDSVLRHRARVGPATLRSAEMCSSCHKAFLDESTGNAHHLVGQDDASPWARSAYAGSDGARIDADVPQKDCRGCHMPRVLATHGDSGQKRGTVASHLFLGGHTWLAAMQGDAELVEKARAFLGNRVSLDIAGLRHESGTNEIIAAASVALVGGERVVVDVALRNLDVGHRFPGGVMDAQGTWVEVLIEDRHGRRVAEAGTNHEASGADPTAHVLASYMAREDGTRLDVRETHEFRAGVFNNTIAPRDATVVGFGFVAPVDTARYPLRVTARLRHRSRNLELQRAACADTRSEQGRSFGRVGLEKVARAIDACKMQPVTDVARSEVWLDAAASGTTTPARAPEPPEVAFDRRYAYGLGLSHSLQERIDDARAPLTAALELARTPRQRAVALGAIAMVAARLGRTEETFALAARADRAANEAGMAPPPAMQRARAEVLTATWRLDEAAPLLLDVASRSPRDDTAWATAAVAFGGAGKPYEALEATRRGLAVQPRDGDLLRVQALSLAGLHAEPALLAATEAAFLERRAPDAAPSVRGKCSARVPGCANERVPVHVHTMRQR
jgi:hypothetical protein